MLSHDMLVPVSMKNMDLGDGFGAVFDRFWQFEALAGGLRKPVVSHHEQI
jgi:hypothetical protein